MDPVRAMAAVSGSPAFWIELPTHYSSPTKVPPGAKIDIKVRVTSGSPKRFTAQLWIRKSATVLQLIPGTTDLIHSTSDPDTWYATMDAGDPSEGLSSPLANRVARVTCYEDDGTTGGAEGDSISRLFRYDWVVPTTV